MNSKLKKTLDGIREEYDIDSGYSKSAKATIEYEDADGELIELEFNSRDSEVLLYSEETMEEVLNDAGIDPSESTLTIKGIRLESSMQKHVESLFYCVDEQ